MAISQSDLETLRDKLIRARMNGIKVVSHGDMRTEFKTDQEMAAAIADLQARIDALDTDSQKKNAPIVLTF